MEVRKTNDARSNSVQIKWTNPIIILELIVFIVADFQVIWFGCQTLRSLSSLGNRDLLKIGLQSTYTACWLLKWRRIFIIQSGPSTIANLLGLYIFGLYLQNSKLRQMLKIGLEYDGDVVPLQISVNKNK